MTLLFLCTIIPLIPILSAKHPILSESIQRELQSNIGSIEDIISIIINLMSNIINCLQKALALSALLFLIQNLINFWCLASSYVFLAVSLPQYFNQTLLTIYNEFNSLFLPYFGIRIQYPNFNASNSSFVNLANAQNYEFNAVSYLLEPTLLAVLTTVQLILFQWVFKTIKSKVREKRQKYENEMISKQVKKFQQLHESKTCKKQIDQPQNILTSLFQNNKISNESNEPQQLKTENQKSKFGDQILDLTYKLMMHQIKTELKNSKKKHWSQEVYFNKLQKLTAIIINYMSGLLMPAYALIIDNGIINFSQKASLFIYYTLLGFILSYPFLFISINLLKKNQKRNAPLLKTSDIQALTQYSLNMCMSVSLGIAFNPYPFLIVTTLMLSGLLIYPFAANSNNDSLKTISWQKINDVVHKFTFWLYNLAFLALYGLICIKDSSKVPNLQTWTYYCSLACLFIFIFGGCHQIIEFAVSSLITICQTLYLLFQIATKEQQLQISEYQRSQGKDITNEIKIVKQRKVKQSLTNIFEVQQEEQYQNQQAEKKIQQCHNIINQLILYEFI